MNSRKMVIGALFCLIVSLLVRTPRKHTLLSRAPAMQAARLNPLTANPEAGRLAPDYSARVLQHGWARQSGRAEFTWCSCAECKVPHRRYCIVPYRKRLRPTISSGWLRFHPVSCGGKPNPERRPKQGTADKSRRLGLQD